MAIRVLAKDPRFTLAAVIALGLGIGVNTSVFGLINAVTLRDLPFDESDRLVIVRSRDARGAEAGVSYDDFRDLQQISTTFAGLAAQADGAMNVREESRAPERVRGTFVSANLFTLLRTAPIAGRDFLPEDDRPGAPPVVIIGHGLWQGRYGGDPAVIGRTVRVNNVPATVIGVMPAGFRYPFLSEVWQPLAHFRRRDESTTRRAHARRSRTLAGQGGARAGASRPRHHRRATRARVSRDKHRDRGVCQTAQRDPAARLPGSHDGVRVRGGVCSAHRLREPRQPAARTFGAPIARDCHPHLARRNALAHRPATADRVRAARGAWRRRSGLHCRWSASTRWPWRSTIIEPGAAPGSNATVLGRRLAELRWCTPLSAPSACSRRWPSVCFRRGTFRRPMPTRRSRTAGAAAAAGARRRWTSALLTAELALTLILLTGTGLLWRELCHAVSRRRGDRPVGPRDHAARAAAAAVPHAGRSEAILRAAGRASGVDHGVLGR